MVRSWQISTVWTARSELEVYAIPHFLHLHKKCADPTVLDASTVKDLNLRSLFCLNSARSQQTVTDFSLVITDVGHTMLVMFNWRYNKSCLSDRRFEAQHNIQFLIDRPDQTMQVAYDGSQSVTSCLALAISILTSIFIFGSYLQLLETEWELITSSHMTGLCRKQQLYDAKIRERWYRWHRA